MTFRNRVFLLVLLCAGCDRLNIVIVDGCVSDFDCEDENDCTLDSCDDGLCSNVPIRDCSVSCISDVDCDDRKECTLDRCLSGFCTSASHEPDSCNPDHCRFQCESECGDESLTFSEVLEDAILETECSNDYTTLLTGMCGDETQFIYISPGLFRKVRYFTGDGLFVGWAAQSDNIDSRCCGLTFWPVYVECKEAHVTQVICSPSYQIGESITPTKSLPCEIPVPGSLQP